MDFADTVQPEEQDANGRPVRRRAAQDESDPEIGLVRPGALWVPDAVVPATWASNPVTPNRLVIGIVAALVLVALGLLLDRVYLDRQSEASRQREFKANVERVQSAMDRGDMGAAERVLESLDADHADEPAVQALREAFERRLQEQAAKREQLRDATVKASKAIGIEEAAVPPAQPRAQPRDTAMDAAQKALGLGEPAAPRARTPVPAAAPKVATPAPAIGVADPKEKECNDTLAALALCSQR